jgi:hypothetical protein
MSHIRSNLHTSHTSVKSGPTFYLLLLLTLGVALAGCSNQMEPAQKALTEIELTVASVGPDGQRYIPDQVKAVNDQLANLQARFEQKDYAGVISGAPAVLAKAQLLVAAKDAAVEAAVAKQAADAAASEAAEVEALQANWQTLSDELPKQIAAISSRLTHLAKSKKLPANVTKDALNSAQADLAAAQSSMTAATTAQSAGDIRNAVAAAQQGKEKADAAMKSLGMASG